MVSEADTGWVPCFRGRSPTSPHPGRVTAPKAWLNRPRRA